MKIYLNLRQKVTATFFVSLISIVLSITAVVRCEPMQFDAVVLLSSIISIPVAVFAITQAFNFLWYENKIKSGLEDLSKELRHDVKTMENDMRIAIRSYHLLISGREHIVRDFDGHIQGALNAIIEDSKSKNHIASKDILDQLCLYMKNYNQQKCQIDMTRKTDYIKALSKIDDGRIPEICDFIYSCIDIKDNDKKEKDDNPEKIV